jgi:ubiquinone/menaquinone biosynthesis C-methylase UbiE
LRTRARHDPSDPAAAYLTERRDADLRALLHSLGLPSLSSARILDAGCGDGRLLARFVEWGAAPERLAGVDLSEARVARARERVPGARIERADAAALPFPDGVFDLVTMCTLLSSIIDGAQRTAALREASRVLRSGGWLVVYDFPWNPLNREVRPVSLDELRRALPDHAMSARRVTLAPPLARLFAGRAPAVCRVLERLPFLRSHVLVAIGKP